MRRALVALVLSLVTTFFVSADEPEQLFGFTAAGSDAQRALEARFDALLVPENLRRELETLSARPHHLGSPGSKAVAEHLVALFRSWGYDAALETFQVLFPTPKVRVLELVAPTKFTAQLAEPALAEDRTSGQKAEQLPTYNAYSADGDVTGELVYVNYGVPADYEELVRRGIDVRGKIVIARYGGSWRGIKPKVAAEHGAIGCLIYSDPAGDGFVQGDAYPAGGWRSESSVQRGSVADMPIFPGDPLTPGVGATKDAKRLERAAAPTIMKIPVLPISAADAQPLLAALGGSLAPANWRGALPLTYRLGPGAAKVHLKLEFDWRLVPAYDVVAKLPGRDLPEQWVVRGNHHDAWVNGATDPLSGMVAVLEEARAVGALAKAGQRPRRTIVYAGWDGEEPGLLGSTEWVEFHAEELRQKAVAYINTDSTSRGLLDQGGSHSLERLMGQIGREVMDPVKGVSVAQRVKAGLILDGSPEARDRRDLRLDPLGSGSDYTPFLQHLGIAALNLGFGGESDYGQYHSIYDTYDHYIRFMDPDFAYGTTLVKVAGRATLRLANAETLPFDFTALADTVGGYVKEVEELAERQKKDADERNRRLDEGAYAAADDARSTWNAPPRLEPGPFFNFAPLKNAHAALVAAAKAYDAALAAKGGAGGGAAVDRILLAAERSLTRPEGLPGRPWFQHFLYAPGQYTGYGVKTLPAIREALEQREFGRVESGIAATAAAIQALAEEIRKATAAVG